MCDQIKINKLQGSNYNDSQDQQKYLYDPSIVEVLSVEWGDLIYKCLTIESIKFHKNYE